MSAAEEDGAELEELLAHIRDTRGVNFTGYKRSTLGRRIHKRMADVAVAGYQEYRELLERDPEEYDRLLDTVLINVTSFFRDRPAWDYLADHIIPALVEHKRPEDPIRVWSAGCASGEEAYTIALLLAEALGIGPLRNRVKIYATDIDDDALAQARQGVYGPKEMVDIPEPLRDRYLEVTDTRVVFRNGLRRAVIFGRHDLTADAPIGRIDLLICRNTLMYFNAETQARVLDRLQFALNGDGYLFLGKAEMILAHSSLFTPVSTKFRIFAKAPTSAPQPLVPGRPATEANTSQARVGRHLQLRDLLVDMAPGPLIAVDANGQLTIANLEARTLFGLSAGDLGEPLQNFEVSYRPVELRSRLEQAYDERRPVQVRNAERTWNDNQPRYFDVTVTPMVTGDDQVIGAAISFVDVTYLHQMRDELQHSREELETTYEELRSTNEELETGNEELQSTNEELETTNEELQSTNEELETTNEELRSTNEELETMNDQLRTGAAQLEQLNERLESLLSSLLSAVVVVDRELLVNVWNHAAEELWGLRAEEVTGRSLATLDVGLPVSALQPALRACLDERSEREVVEVEGVTRTGRPVRFRAVCAPVTDGPPPSGVVLVVDELEA